MGAKSLGCTGRTAPLSLTFILVISGLAWFTITGPSMEDGRAGAATIVVDPMGGGDYLKIQYAIENASWGDTIHINAGMYYENLVVDKKLTIIGSGETQTTVSGTNGNPIFDINAHYVRLADLKTTYSGIGYRSDGIDLYGYSYATIENVTCADHWTGVRLMHSDHCAVRNSTFIDNLDSAVDILYADHDSLNGNTMMGCGIYMYSSLASEYTTHDITPDNTVDGKPVRYLPGQNGGTVASPCGQAILGHCTNVVVENLNVSGGSHGILLGFSHNNTIRGNELYQNSRGIMLKGSNDNVIENNTFVINSYGVYAMHDSIDNVIKHNEFRANFYGAFFSMTNTNLVEYNTFVDDQIGVCFDRADLGVVCNNTFKWNYNAIVVDSDSDYGRYCHNNFYLDSESSPTGVADSGYSQWSNGAGEGNYWNDYYGSDDGTDNRPAGDGIGDTQIPHKARDNYPFMEPWGWLTLRAPVLSAPDSYDPDGVYNLSWTRGGPATSYILQEDTDLEFSSPEVIYEGEKRRFEVVHDTDGETFYYRVRGQTESAQSPWSASVSMLLNFPPPPPDGFTVTPYPEGKGLNISWEIPADDIQLYYVYCDQGNGWGYLDHVLQPANWYNHTGLVDGKTYKYMFRAIDWFAQFSVDSEIVEGVPADTSPPPPPSNLSAVNVSHERVLLKWNAVETRDLKGYNIYRTTTPGMSVWGEPMNRRGPVRSTRFDDVEVAEDTTYYYTVTAVDEVPNESPPTGTVEVTTPLAPRAPEVVAGELNVEMLEDAVELPSRDLMLWFEDANGDPLEFTSYGSGHIRALIDQVNGSVTFEALPDWCGEEMVNVTASDGMFTTTASVLVRVAPVNDPPGPPRIVQPAEGAFVLGGTPITLAACCFDPDLPFGDALNITWTSDIDGIIGYGEVLRGANLTFGDHVIKVWANDSQGDSAVTWVNISALGGLNDTYEPYWETYVHRQEQGTNGTGAAGGGASPMTGVLIALVVAASALSVAVLLVVVRNRRAARGPEDGGGPEGDGGGEGTAPGPKTMGPKEPGTGPGPPGSSGPRPMAPQPLDGGVPSPKPMAAQIVGGGGPAPRPMTGQSLDDGGPAPRPLAAQPGDDRGPAPRPMAAQPGDDRGPAPRPMAT